MSRNLRMTRAKTPSLQHVQAQAVAVPTPQSSGDHHHERKYQAVDPSVFAGPAGWVFLHSAAASYEPSMANGFKMLINGFVITFPCERCRGNLVKHLKELPLDKYLGNRDELFLWTYLMHDKVNKLKHVVYSGGQSSPPFEEIKKYYFESLNLHCTNCAV